MTTECAAEGPLAGVRVIAIEQFGAGPFASLFLADLGADVLKIEDPRTGGDVGRIVPPGVAGDSSLYFETFNRGKRSIALDLKSEAGRSVFERLAKNADVVFNNLRGDLPERLGLTYSALGEVNPFVVCASLSAYGRTGPRASEPGHDALVQAETGWAALTGDPGGPPTKSGLSLVDYAAGLTAAFAIVSAVFAAGRSGTGRDVDVSLYDTALTMLSYPATWWLSSAVHAERLPMSAHPSIVPFQFFKTADGYLAIACAKEKFFERLVELANVPDLGADPRFATFEMRRLHREAVLERLAERFAEGTSAEWVTLLRGSVPCAPVRTMEEALDPTSLNDRDLLVEYEHSTLGTVRTVGSPIRLSDWSQRYEAGPRLGQHRDDVLIDAGFSRGEIEELSRRGAFGTISPDQ